MIWPLHNSTSPNKLYGLDTLRALAIILVFFYHYRTPLYTHPDWLTDAAKFGWTGVDLFFVLSGFLIASQLFSQIREHKIISLKAFFLKRFFRILPAYWVVVAIYFCFPFFHERESLTSVWRFLSFTQNFGLDKVNFGTFSHVWSLCVEEHFYFLLPLILIGLQFTTGIRKTYLILIGLFLLGLAIRHYCWSHIYLPYSGTGSAELIWFRDIYYPTYTRLDGLLAGVSIAGIYYFMPGLWLKISKHGNLLLAFSLAILTGAYFICSNEKSYIASVFGFPMIAIGFGLAVAGAVSPGCILYKINSRIAAFLASLSYSIYLTHKGVIHVIQELLSNNIDAHGNLMLLICIVSCLIAGFILNLLIEKPFMKLGRRLMNIN